MKYELQSLINALLSIIFLILSIPLFLIVYPLRFCFGKKVQIKTPKNVLITGASRGVGKTLAMEYAQTSSCIIITGTNSEGLEKARKEIESCGCKCVAEK